MKFKTPVPNILLVLLLFLLSSSCENRQKKDPVKQFSADVIINGGNSSAEIAAVQVTKMGKEVCLSSSRIAYGSIRMEPVFMILGQRAATLAVMAMDADTELHDLPYEQLRQGLLEEGQILE